MEKAILVVVLWMTSSLAFAQRIDNTAAYRQMGGDSYTKIHFENDFFTHTDWYYSQGIAVEFVNPVLSYNPLNKLLIRLDNSAEDNKRYGLAAESNGFTPTDLIQTLPRDRPYAGTLMLKSFLISNNYATKSRMSSSLVLGVIGPMALGKEIQTWIHRWTDNYLPKGWPNQIGNDVIVNYNVNFEQRLFDFGNYVSMYTDLQMNLGTMSDKLQAGVTLMAGKYYSPFAPIQTNERFQIYAYTQPLFSVVAYDATLQGGMFNRNSPYTIRDGELTRLTFENKTGVILQIHRFQVEAFLALLTKEFDAGRMHRWGGLKLGIEL